MISSLLLGIAGGFVLSIPPGPISLAASRQVLAGFLRNGVKIVLAAALMDIVYMLIATFASSAIVRTVRNLLADSVWFALIFQIVCAIILAVLGILFLLPQSRAYEEKVVEERERAQEQRAKSMGHSSPFFVGLLMAVTNLASPAFLPSMIAFVGFLQANKYLMQSPLDNVLFSAGFGVGTMTWFVVVMRILKHYRGKLSTSFLNWFYRFAGATMLVFACVVALHIIVSTPWSALV